MLTIKVIRPDKSEYKHVSYSDETMWRLETELKEWANLFPEPQEDYDENLD